MVEEAVKVAKVEPPTSPLREGKGREVANASLLYHFDANNIQLEGEEDPRNWSQARKWYTTSVISLMGFISPLGSSIVVPGGQFVDHDFHLHSRTLSLLTVSFFVLGLGVGPFLLAPASELRGRHPIYLGSSLVFVLLNLGSTLVHNFPGLIILRFLAGAAGSTGPSLGAGSIGDMFVPRERGRAQSLYGLGPLLGPVCGTIAGGWIAQALHSWRWLLGTLTILSAVILLIVLISLRETYGPVLLRKKVRKLALLHLEEVSKQEPTNPRYKEAWEAHCNELRKLTSSAAPISFNKLSPRFNRVVGIFLPSTALIQKLKLALSRPFRLLFLNPICAMFSLYMGYIYGIIFIFITQHPLLFERRMDPSDPSPQRLPTYGWSEGVAGLSYIGLGLGFLAAASVNVLLQDTIYARLVLSKGKLGWFLFRAPASFAEYILNQKEPIEVVSDVEKQVEKSKQDKDKVEAVSGSTSKQAPTVPVLSPPPPPPPPPASPLGKGRPEFRLPLCLLGMIILPIGLFTFGWTANYRVHFMGPLVGSFMVGMGSILPFQAILVYLVDAFIPYSASATACAVLVRCVLAAVFPLFSQQLFVATGYGWGSSLLAFISLLAIPVPIYLYRHGESLRNSYKFEG